jgi:hypothetical protein
MLSTLSSDTTSRPAPFLCKTPPVSLTEAAIATVEVYMLQHAITTYQELCETEFKLVLQQLILIYCSVLG